MFSTKLHIPVVCCLIFYWEMAYAADFSAYTVTKSGWSVSLTTKEIEILKILIEDQGNVLLRMQILDGVWGFYSEIADRIVDTHIKNLRKKLDCKSIHRVKGIGYRFEVKGL